MKRILPLFATLFLLSQVTFGQEIDDRNPVLSENFFIYAGIFSPFKQVSFGFQASLPDEDDNLIDFDEVLNIKGIQTSFTANFYWRFSKNWSLNSDYFSLRTKNSYVLDQDIVWDKYTLKKGTSVEGGYGASVLKVGVGRTIVAGKKHEQGALLGVYLLGLNGFLSGNALLNDKEVELDKSKVSVTLPLPSIGLSYIYAPTKKLSLYAKGEWFGIKIANIDGSLWNFTPGIRYQFFKHIGANLNYKYLNLTGSVDQKEWKGSFELEFQGPSFGIIATF